VNSNPNKYTHIKEKEKSLTNFLLSSKIKIMQEIRQLRMQLPDFEILCAVWHSKSRYLQAGGLDYGYDDDAKNSGCSSRAVRGKGRTAD
jgi:hypothetical protein